MSTKCVFCRIINGEIPGSFVYKDEHTVAFNDLNPQAPVHVLVVPTEHVESLTDERALDGVMLGRVFSVIRRLASELKLEEGFRVVVNCGTYGGQTVPHIHFHLLGRRCLAWPPG